MVWKIEFEPQTEKDLRDMGPSDSAKILDFFEKLESHPDPLARAKPLRGLLKGLYRYRIDELRAIVGIDTGACLITVLQVGHRKNIYG